MHKKNGSNCSILEAWEQGYDACNDNKSVKENPYETGTDFAYSWESGFRTAWALGGD